MRFEGTCAKRGMAFVVLPVLVFHTGLVQLCSGPTSRPRAVASNVIFSSETLAANPRTYKGNKPLPKSILDVIIVHRSIRHEVRPSRPPAWELQPLIHQFPTLATLISKLQEKYNGWPSNKHTLQEYVRALELDAPWQLTRRDPLLVQYFVLSVERLRVKEAFNKVNRALMRYDVGAFPNEEAFYKYCRTFNVVVPWLEKFENKLQDQLRRQSFNEGERILLWELLGPQVALERARERMGVSVVPKRKAREGERWGDRLYEVLAEESDLARYRDALILRWWYGWTIEEISSVTGVHPRVTQEWLNRGLSILALAIGRRGVQNADQSLRNPAYRPNPASLYFELLSAPARRAFKAREKKDVDFKAAVKAATQPMTDEVIASQQKNSFLRAPDEIPEPLHFGATGPIPSKGVLWLHRWSNKHSGETAPWTTKQLVMMTGASDHQVGMILDSYSVKPSPGHSGAPISAAGRLARDIVAATPGEVIPITQTALAQAVGLSRGGLQRVLSKGDKRTSDGSSSPAEPVRRKQPKTSTDPQMSISKAAADRFWTTLSQRLNKKSLSLPAMTTVRWDNPKPTGPGLWETVEVRLLREVDLTATEVIFDLTVNGVDTWRKFKILNEHMAAAFAILWRRHWVRLPLLLYFSDTRVVETYKYKISA